MKLLVSLVIGLFSLSAHADSYGYVFYDGSSHTIEVIKSGNNAWLQVPGLNSVILLSEVDQPKIEKLDVMTSEQLDPAKHGNSVEGLSQINIVLDHGSNHPVFYEGIDFVRELIDSMSLSGESSVNASKACPLSTSGVMIMHFTDNTEPYVVCLTKNN